jgi:cell wall-associated NlpC family hydrolase
VSALDKRLHPYRPDLAAAHLRGQVEAERFVEGTAYEVIEPIADVRRAPSPDAPLDTQALYGERVIVYESNGEGWAWGQIERDSYVGWLPESALAQPEPAPTHQVIVPRTLCFAAPDIKRPPLAALPMNARIAIARQDEKFAIAENGWHLPAPHVAPLDTAYPDFVAVAEMFAGAPYLWGGKSALGIDCSGLVQVSMHAAGRECPRDSDMQEAALGRAVALGELTRGDLLFWPGHVAIACDALTMVHANAHHMMVAREAVKPALERIGAAGSELRTIKRL